jgi:multifunctional methyltransferase subunit TRM112
MISTLKYPKIEIARFFARGFSLSLSDQQKSISSYSHVFMSARTIRLFIQKIYKSIFKTKSKLNMRLLTHNTMRNNSAAAKGKGYPLKITPVEIRVDDANEIASDPGREIAFVKGILGMLDWGILVQGASQMGLTTLPETLTDEMVHDDEFLRALYHVLMNVHLVRGMLTCPDTGREFPVLNSIVDFTMEESECENVRY